MPIPRRPTCRTADPSASAGEGRRKVRRLPALRKHQIALYWRMSSPADLERITYKLDQAYAIMAFSDGDARLSAVRILLGQIRNDDMPTRATRAHWSHIEETLLRLGTGAVASTEIRGLGAEVHQLRDAIVLYLSRIPY